MARETTSDRSGAVSAHTTTVSTNMLPAQKELRRQPSDDGKDWQLARQGNANRVSWRRLKTSPPGSGQGMASPVWGHSCDRVGTPLLLNRDRTTGMSGEGNRSDVTGRILFTHKTRRSHIPRRWRTPLSLSSFS
jgi:hypothetical protein